MRHPDEGAIQGWLEGQLPADEAREVASHVEGCAECGALAAEIRGLMARTTGIVAALDEGEARTRPLVSAPAERVTGARRPRVAWRRWAPALAAAVVVLAVMRQASSDGEGREGVREALRGDGRASTPAVAAAPAPPPVAVPAPTPAPAAGSAADAAARVSPPAAPSGAPPVAQRAATEAAEQVAALAVGSGGAGAESSRAGMAGGTTGALSRGVAATAAARDRAEDAAMKARRPAPAMMAMERNIITTITGCYRVISQDFSRLILVPGGEATIVAADSSVGGWTAAGDSVMVRWGDSLAVFPAGAARTTGRLEVRGESRPLTVWRGCPGR